MPKRRPHRGSRRMKTSADTSTRTNVQPDDDIPPSLLMEDWANEIERAKAWVIQLRRGLEAEGMTSVALTHDAYVAVVELEFLIPENRPLPSAQDIEALLLRVAVGCGREFSPHGMLVLTDQRRCKVKFDLAR